MPRERVDGQEGSPSTAPLTCVCLEANRGSFHLGPVDLSVGIGMTVLVGRNGAGKTTLLRTMVGLIRPTAGEVQIAGSDPHHDRQAREARRQIGYVPQGAQVPPAARVEDIVAYAAWLKGVPRSETRGLVDAAMTALDITPFARRRARTLSGGERQRVSLAMALVHRPSVLVLDEPSVGLDPVQRVQLRRTLDALAAERAVLVSTHLVEDIGSEDAVVALAKGRVTFDGRAADLTAGDAPAGTGSTTLEQGLWNLLGGDER